VVSTGKPGSSSTRVTRIWPGLNSECTSSAQRTFRHCRFWEVTTAVTVLAADPTVNSPGASTRTLKPGLSAAAGVSHPAFARVPASTAPVSAAIR
jgi:hypothetical protein